MVLKENVTDYSDMNLTSKWSPFKFVGLVNLEESWQSWCYRNNSLCHKIFTFLTKTGFKPGTAVRAGEELGVPVRRRGFLTYLP